MLNEAEASPALTIKDTFLVSHYVWQPVKSAIDTARCIADPDGRATYANACKALWAAIHLSPDLANRHEKTENQKVRQFRAHICQDHEHFARSFAKGHELWQHHTELQQA